MRISLIITLCLIGQFSIARFGEPLIGQEYSTSKKENFSGFLGETEISVFTADYIYYTKRKQELIIRKFHKSDLQLIDSKNIYTLVKEGFTNDPEEIFQHKGSLYLFSTMQSDRDRTQLISLEIFDESLERTSMTIVDSVKSDEISHIEITEDKNGFLIAKHLKYTQLVEQEIEMVRISNNGDIEWRKIIKSPMALQNIRIEQIAFASEGPIYYLCNYAFDITTGDNSTSDQLVNNKYSLWAYDKATNFMKEFEIRLKGKWVNGVKMDMRNNQDLVISGFFNESKNQTVNGVFSLIINSKLEVVNTAWHKFDSDELAMFDKKDKKIKEIADVKIKNLALMNDGSFYLLGEQFFKYTERSYDPRTNVTTTTEHFNYNSIVASYFDKRGNHVWTEHIPKYQNSTNDFGYFSSFALLNSGEDIALFFNDNEKNNMLENPSYNSYTSVFNNRKFQISYALINEDGLRNRGGLIDPKNNFILRAKMSGQINEDGIYLITETNRSSKLIRVPVKSKG